MTEVQYREATSQDDKIVAECFVKMWQGIGVPDDCFHPEQLQQSLDFISEARHYDLKSYIAEKNGSAIGTASGHLFHGLYPDIISKKRKIGYIWGVWVHSTYRKQGIASELMNLVVQHLKAINCTQIMLHASPQGKPVYKRLGFEADDSSLVLKLSHQVPGVV